MPSDLVLGFDTSGPWIRAALVRGGDVLALIDQPMAKGQSEALMTALDALLRQAGVRWQDLDGIGTGTGPGNFTGVRIAVAAARGLALGLGIPAIGVTGFEALALDGPALPSVLPALRSQCWVLAPDHPPALSDMPPTRGIGTGTGLTPPAHPQPVAIARLAAARLHQPAPRPAPLYLREADAAPASEKPPALIG